MKRAIFVATSVLQVVLLAGMGALLWLDKNSMGVMRYLANKNRVWNHAPWTGWLLIAAAIAMAALLVWAGWMLVSPKTKTGKGPWLLLALFSVLALLFGLVAKTGTVRPYYFMCIILVLVTLLQAAKCAYAK